MNLLVLVCFCIRYLLSILVKKTLFTETGNKARLDLVYSFIAICVAIIWILQYFDILFRRKKSIINNDVWWNHMRPFHSLMYIIFAVATIMRKRSGWKVLTFDSLVGVTRTILYYDFGI